MTTSDLETAAWHRARKYRLIELAAALAAGSGLVVLVMVFYSILTRQ
ncbi:MAG TPA: hypothetical protein VN853_07410 [Polyangia bacterium]|nr:hypothetical protein [Polyangia bacterium]